MSNAASQSANTPAVPDLGPLTLTLDPQRWSFKLSSPDEMTLELPPDYERFLTERLEPLFASEQNPQFELTLDDLPGLSSRQLGLMLALHKALADRCERLPLAGVSSGVRRLLNLTRTARFFDFK